MIDIKGINQADLWYIIGYIVADGNLSKSGRHIAITSKDVDHLVKMKNALGLTRPLGKGVTNSTGKVYGRIQFSDVNFYRFLLSINIGPKKSLVQGPVKVNPLYIADFIRGEIDGDGCIRSWIHDSNGHTQWTITVISAAPNFIYWFKYIIENKYKIRGKIYIRDSKVKNTVYIIKFGKIASQVLIRNIYYPGCLSLERKYKLAMSCLLDKSKMVNYNSVIQCPGGEIGQPRKT